jgi:uncharacterized protein (DUF488 family)
MSTTGKVYLLGFWGRTVEDVQRIVADRNAILVDVRLVPFSRWARNFNRESLIKVFGSGYVHAEGLGNVNYKGGPVRLFRPRPTLDELCKRLDAGDNLVLMCVCKYPERCHRSEVACLFAERGYAVECVPAFGMEATING